MCVEECSDGFYENVEKHKCDNCSAIHKSCLKCNADYCTKCESNYFLDSLS